MCYILYLVSHNLRGTVLMLQYSSLLKIICIVVQLEFILVSVSRISSTLNTLRLNLWQEIKHLQQAYDEIKTAAVVDIQCQLADRSHDLLLGK